MVEPIIITDDDMILLLEAVEAKLNQCLHDGDTIEKYLKLKEKLLDICEME